MLGKERKLLPSTEEIKQMTLEDLQLLEEEVDVNIAQIQVNLEYGEGDDDWYGRAKGALTAHEICRSAVRKAINKLGGNEYHNLKHQRIMEKNQQRTQRIELQTKLTQEKRENQKLELEKQKIASQNKAQKATLQKQEFINKLSYMHIFHSICYKMLSADQFMELSQLSQEKHQEKIRIEVE